MQANTFQSALFAKALLCVTAALVLVPPRLLLALAGDDEQLCAVGFQSSVGVGVFTKHLRRLWKQIEEGEDPQQLRKAANEEADDGNIILNFLDRAPFPWDNQCCEKNLPKELKHA